MDIQFPDEARRNARHPLGYEWFAYEFANGYGASVIRGEHSYGGSSGLWEVAVTQGGSLCYDTPLTDDVIGYRSEEQVCELLRRIAELEMVTA